MADEALRELLDERYREIAELDEAIGEFNAGCPAQLRLIAKRDALKAKTDAALSELARLRAERDWRDISTAPWSGPPVLLWKPSTSEHYVAARISGEHGPGWCTPDGYEVFRATHWQPLPAPPVQSHEEKHG